MFCHLFPISTLCRLLIEKEKKKNIIILFEFLFAMLSQVCPFQSITFEERIKEFPDDIHNVMKLGYFSLLVEIL